MSTSGNIGEYRIQEFLGAGGMGEVYRAVHSKIGRVVAIKVLTQHEPSFIERFLNEARIQGSVQHPNIATLYDFLENQGRPCIVMEFIDGETLSQLITRHGKLTLEQALPVYGAVVEAVAHIHGKGIIHRDIKSNNVKIDSQNRVKLLDFGIARSGSSPKITATGNVVGTLHYLSPELVKGASADIRSDIWALGILLYEMLTGEVPFQGANTLNLCEKITKSTCRPISAINPDVPQAVEMIVARCLRKSPADRYQSAGHLVADLHRCGLAQPDGPPPTSTGHKALQGWLRTDGKRKAALGAGLVLIIVILGLYMLFAPSGSPPEAPAGPAPSPKTSASPAQPEFRAVIVDVAEGRADVYRNGELAGRTPFEIRARVGDAVDLVLKRQGYADRRVQFDVTANRRVYTFDLDAVR